MRLWLDGIELTGAASYTLSKAELEAPRCPRCDGGGEVHWNPSPIGDPQCEESATCPRCGGDGTEPEEEHDA